MAKPIPTFERCHELLKLDPETGILTWRIRNGAKKGAGDRAGWLVPANWYRYVCLDGVDYQEHIVVWFMLYGEWIPRRVDHHDRDRANNRQLNLRRANESQQRSNAKLRSDNSTGERGVTCHQDGGYVARVEYQGSYCLRKYYQNFDDAVAAAKAMRLKVFGQFAPAYDQQGAI